MVNPVKCAKVLCLSGCDGFYRCTQLATRWFRFIDGGGSPRCDEHAAEDEARQREFERRPGFEGVILQGQNGPLKVIADPHHSTWIHGPGRLVNRKDNAE